MASKKKASKANKDKTAWFTEETILTLTKLIVEIISEKMSPSIPSTKLYSIPSSKNQTALYRATNI